MISIEDALRIVHAERQVLARLQNVLAASRAEWDTANKETLEAIQQHQQLLGEADTLARQEGLALYQATGDKKPAPGVAIRIVPHINYAVAEALAWAKKHDMALALDTKAFEALAKTQDIPGVLKTETIQVTLVQDLGPIIAGYQEPQTGDTP